MKWLVTGAAGMLAQDVIAAARQRGHAVIGLPRTELNLLDPDSLASAVAEHRPDVIVNCAAWTAVDAAETEQAAAFNVNATGAQNLARAAESTGAKLVHISTDYVFDGQQETPYEAGAALSPLGAYGRTKAAGEWAVQTNCSNVYLIRTAWLYGSGGKCFPKTLAKVLRDQGEARVVSDQYGQPTWTADVARLIVDLVDKADPGTYHATSEGETSWWGFTREIATTLGLSPEVVEPISSDAYPSVAPRPKWSSLSHDTVRAAGVEPIGPWQERWKVASTDVIGA